ncbi:MAG: SH3 domain-containing protein [Chloroflexi bacterium]|nr:SH3 domain-containing protein [Chloroflexota bacterium]
MIRNWFPAFLLLLFLTLVSTWALSESTLTVAHAQQPTDTPGGETSTSGIYITVITEEPQINVRMGPSSSIYPIVGILPRGATAPALGRSQGGDWIKIEFEGAPNNSGWVYSPLVQVSSGTLRVVEPPPTPVPPATSTVDPTLAAQFVIVPTNTRLPTFTPPPSLTSIIYTSTPEQNSQNSVPVAAIIITLFILGVFGFLLSVVIRR